MKELRLYDSDHYCEVTLRTAGGDFGFDLNDTGLRDLIYGVFAEAIQRYNVAVFVFHFMSNHYHGLYGFSSAEQLVMFFAFLHGNLARLAHRTNGTKGKFWAPLKVFAVAKDAESVGRRVRYIMGQAVAAGLVDHPGQFPGASSVDAMLYGTRLMGRQFDNTSRCRDAARLVGGAKADEAYETWVELPLSVPTCWADLSGDELRRMYAGIAAELAGGGADLGHGHGQSCGDCLIHENTNNCWGQAIDDEAPSGSFPPPAAARVGTPEEPASAGPEPSPAPAAGREPVCTQPPKARVPTRVAEDGGRYSHGPVKPKRMDGKRNRGRPPRLLSVDERMVDEYEERYQESVAGYGVAKAGWRGGSKLRSRALHGVAITLPPGMLLGTLPLRLGGEGWAGCLPVIG